MAECERQMEECAKLAQEIEQLQCQMEECAKLAQEIEQLQCLEASLEAPLETKH
jgi:hypothetical protein